MNAIRKVTKVKHASISFNELSELNDQDVEVIVFPLAEQHDVAGNRKKIQQYSGIIKSNYMDTSENVDVLIYGK